MYVPHNMLIHAYCYLLHVTCIGCKTHFILQKRSVLLVMPQKCVGLCFLFFLVFTQALIFPAGSNEYYIPLGRDSHVTFTCTYSMNVTYDAEL